jgi:hypothetical protein
VLHFGNAEVVGNFRALNFYKASDRHIKQDIERIHAGKAVVFPSKPSINT